MQKARFRKIRFQISVYFGSRKKQTRPRLVRIDDFLLGVGLDYQTRDIDEAEQKAAF